MAMLRLSLMMVVLVDFMGQGLILPIINTLLLEPTSTFLPSDMPEDPRELLYGLLLATFYLSWFFGAAYVSKLSDYIGRKNGIVICLVGALAGYTLTVVAMELSNVYLLFLGRAISGFTAGNQPIAQAALIDISANDDERTRNMGKIVAASALGLVAGPLLAGVLSDPEVMGRFATLELPFICAALLVLLTLVMILVFYRDARTERRKIDFGLGEVVLNLWRLRGRPTIIKISAVWFFFELGLNAFALYLDDYMIERFQFETLQNSVLMGVFGLTMAVTSGLLVGMLSSRFRKVPIVAGALLLMPVGVALFIASPDPNYSYFLVVPVVAGFAIGYPVMLALFSASAGEDEQGWVMGVTIALFTLGSGFISLAGGAMMDIDARLPFVFAIACFVVALACVATLWRQADIRALDSVGA